jgi:segregation and condensation protein B|tara:strand:- start:56 stop:637 length:582 start_codon:yes stop_codon:yes gene_type:complete
MSDSNENNLDFNFKLKVVEALIFASPEPVSLKELMKTKLDIEVLEAVLKSLEKKYSSGGFNLYRINNSYAFRTSPEVSEFLNVETIVPRALSRAASETLAIIAYHQPITRSEIENIRGVSLSKGTLDALLELNWIKPGQRKSTPGNPLTWRTSDTFLDHFGLKEISDLPGIDDLKNSGLLEKDNVIFRDEPVE